jgi:hypothetical protein
MHIVHLYFKVHSLPTFLEYISKINCLCTFFNTFQYIFQYISMYFFLSPDNGYKKSMLDTDADAD